jgi:hypothetical protein
MAIQELTLDLLAGDAEDLPMDEQKDYKEICQLLLGAPDRCAVFHAEEVSTFTTVVFSGQKEVTIERRRNRKRRRRRKQ